MSTKLRDLRDAQGEEFADAERSFREFYADAIVVLESYRIPRMTEHDAGDEDPDHRKAFLVAVEYLDIDLSDES